MKRHHTYIVLLTLFFTGLLVLWWAPYADIPTERQRLERSGRVLPALLEVAPDKIQRVEVDRPRAGPPAARIVFERDGDGWRMRAPVVASADSRRVETLVRTLKNLPRSGDAGTIAGAPETFGFAPPSAIVHLYDGAHQPLAALEVGKTAGDKQYVRPLGAAGIEVVDPNPFRGIDNPAPDWRDRAVFGLSTFQVNGITVEGPDRALQAERSGSHWRLTRPHPALADDEKVEGVIAELTSLRVADGGRGFAADAVKDFAPFGLDRPALTITLQASGSPPKVVTVGKPAPGTVNRVYARRGDEASVILIDGKHLHDLGVKPIDLRSHFVNDLAPALVERVEIRSPSGEFVLDKKAGAWTLAAPTAQAADPALVQGLLTQLAELQTSEFLDESRVDRSGLDPPVMRVRVWQAPRPGTPAPQSPRLTLRIGRHDPLRKTVYARVEGDPVVLALPDNVLDALPRNALAYRDRTVVALNVGDVTRLSVRRDGRSFVIEPAGASSQPNQWRLIEPVEAPADDQAVTKALTTLSALHADRFIADRPGDGKAYGLDLPTLTVSWTTRPAATAKGSTEPARETLLVGTSPRDQPRFFHARLESSHSVFLLDETALQPFREEFHTPNVLSFPSKMAKRVVLRWPDRALSFARQPEPRLSPIGWRPEPGGEAAGFDLSRLSPLVSGLGKLTTRKFLQYDGPIPPSAGLDPARLTVEVEFYGNAPRQTLRVGAPFADGEYRATTATGDSGPVFLLSATGWGDLIQSGRAAGELPDDVFAPAPGPAPK